MTAVINEAGLIALFTDKEGGIARDLERHGVRIARNARTRVSRPWPRGSLNPPPGPPFLREGDLYRSIEAQAAEVDAEGMYVDVTAVPAKGALPDFAFSRGEYAGVPYELITEADLIE